MTETRTTCPYCGVGCGVIASVEDGAVSVRGDDTHPANFGRLCVKGSALGETTGLQGRLLYPVVDGLEVDWSQALNAAGERLREIIDTWGPRAVAFYASGQLLTEDYYAANKLMKGFIGAANIDTNSRLCMSSAVVEDAKGQRVSSNEITLAVVQPLVALPDDDPRWKLLPDE